MCLYTGNRVLASGHRRPYRLTRRELQPPHYPALLRGSSHLSLLHRKKVALIPRHWQILEKCRWQLRTCCQQGRTTRHQCWQSHRRHCHAATRINRGAHTANATRQKTSTEKKKKVCCHNRHFCLALRKRAPSLFQGLSSFLLTASSLLLRMFAFSRLAAGLYSSTPVCSHSERAIAVWWLTAAGKWALFADFMVAHPKSLRYNQYSPPRVYKINGLPMHWVLWATYRRSENSRNNQPHAKSGYVISGLHGSWDHLALFGMLHQWAPVDSLSAFSSQLVSVPSTCCPN